MALVEINFDGIVGPSHNYAGLSLGNIASASHKGDPSYPRAAALQGVAKMRGNMARGLAQGYLLPLPRPRAETLRRLGVHPGFEEGNLVKGIDEIKRSINILNSINYQNKEEIAELYQTLATYYETYGEFDKEIEALTSKYELLEELYGHADKRTLKAKRTIAMTLLKREKHKEAIEELEEVQEIEEKVYG